MRNGREMKATDGSGLVGNYDIGHRRRKRRKSRRG